MRMSAAVAVTWVVAAWAVLVVATVVDPAARVLGRRRWWAAVWWAYPPVIVVAAFAGSQSVDPLPWSGAAGAAGAFVLAGFVAGAGRPFRVARALPAVTGEHGAPASSRRAPLVFVVVWSFSLLPAFALTM